MTPNKKKRITLWALAVIYGSPFLIAFYLFTHANLSHLGTTNKGALITPVVPLKQLSLHDYSGAMPAETHKWRLVSYQTNCDEACLKQLSKLLNVRKALGKGMTSTEQWLITEKPIGSPLLAQLTDNKRLNSRVLLGRPSKALGSQATQQIFLLDPNGLVMMRYQANVASKDIYQDLQHLLKVSKAG